MLRLYYSDVSDLDIFCERTALSEYRLEKLNRQKGLQTRRLSLGAELLLIRAMSDLGVEAPLKIDVQNTGKPALSGTEFDFNLSHSDSMVFCGVSDLPVGVDVQRVRPFNRALAERRFTHREREWLENKADVNTAYSLLWSLKESYIKHSGLGISACSPESFEMLVLEDGEAYVTGRQDVRFWYNVTEEYVYTACFDSCLSVDCFEKIELV